MTYSDFTLDRVRRAFALTIHTAALFPHVTPIEVPQWLQDTLDRAMPLALGSEKARSEFIIAPLLLCVRELSHQRVSVYSGQCLDVDAAAGLVGECDFILTDTEPVPVLQSPIMSVVEAKKMILRVD